MSRKGYTPVSKKLNPNTPHNRYPAQCTLDVDELMKLEMLSETVDNSAVYNSALYQNAQILTNPANTVITKTSAGTMVHKNETAIEQLYVNFYSTLRNGTLHLSSGQLGFNLPEFNRNLTVQNVIQLEIYPFLIRTIMNPTAGGVNYFYYNRVYMMVTSLATNLGFNGGNLQSYTFEFQTDNSNAVCTLLTPKNPLITFPAPLQMNTFNVQFFVPDVFGLKPISLPQDVVVVRPVYVGGFGLNPAQFTIVSSASTADISVFTGVLSTSNPDNRIAVLFNGFNSTNTTLNNTVMSTYGWLVTNIINTTTFEIAGLDLSSLTPPTIVSAYDSNMLIMPNKIDFGVRFTILKNTKTNSLTPVVS